jgi:putative lipoprotein
MLRWNGNSWLAGVVVILSVFGLTHSGLTQSAGAQSSSAPAAAAQPLVSGTISYSEHVTLPPDAAIEVKLQDVTGKKTITVAESVFSAGGRQVPIPFSLTYNPDDINPAHKYQINANISVNDKPMFISSTAYPVITHDAPSKVSIVLQQAASEPMTTGERKLRGTVWHLVDLGGQPAAPAENRPAHLVLHDRGALSGSTGCNTITGSYIAEQGALQFTPATSTMTTCEPTLMAQEQALFAAMKATSNYRIDGEMLELLNGKQVLAKFQAKPKP